MPKTSLVSSASLGIRLDQGQSQYAPGETVAGYVFRRQPILSSGATLIVSLHGRTKTKIVVPEGNNGSSSYRSRYNLLDEARNSQTIFEGPIHIPAGGDEQSWPFIINIPTHVDNLSLGESVEDGRATYLPLDPAYVATHELPASFALGESGSRTSMEAFVEYYIQAELFANIQDSVETKTASLPLTMWHLSQDPPIADFQLRKDKDSQSISAYRLTPGMEHMQLSLSQKTRQLFNSAKVPTLGFNVHTKSPTVIQLDNPNYIPFIVRAAPEWSKTTKAIRGIQPKARIRSLSLKIVAKTGVRCPGLYYTCNDSFEEKVDLDVSAAISGRDIVIPITDEAPAVDIGKLVNLRIGSRGRIGSKHSKGRITPDFDTYNIQHTHRLKWRMVVEIAGEESEISSSHPITILRPSDESNGAMISHVDMSLGLSTLQPWIKPPDEEVAPPSFEQAQQHF